jgi:hypothetical protein
LTDDMLDVSRRDRHGLIGNIGVALAIATRFDTQRIFLVAPGKRDNRARHGSREKQGFAVPAASRREFFKLFAKAHVEHLIGFVEYRDPKCRKVQRSSLQMIAQPAWSSDNDMSPRPAMRGAPSSDPCRRHK